MEAGPQFQVRPWAASAPPAEPAFGAGAVQPAPGADGTTVRASQPPDLARREQGEDGGGTPPKRRAGRPARGPRRTDRIQRGPRRSRALSGPPWSASGGWGSGRVALPVELEGLQGRACSPPWSMSRTGTMRPSRLLRKLAARRRALAGLNKGEAHHALKRQLPPTRRTAGTRTGEGRHCRVAGPQPDGCDHHLLEHVEARRCRLREEAGRVGLIDLEHVPGLSSVPARAAACRRPAPALAPVPASALAPVPAPAPALA